MQETKNLSARAVSSTDSIKNQKKKNAKKNLFNLFRFCLAKATIQIFVHGWIFIYFDKFKPIFFSFIPFFFKSKQDSLHFVFSGWAGSDHHPCLFNQLNLTRQNWFFFLVAFFLLLESILYCIEIANNLYSWELSNKRIIKCHITFCLVLNHRAPSSIHLRLSCGILYQSLFCPPPLSLAVSGLAYSACSAARAGCIP